jgi:hypothetical protein
MNLLEAKLQSVPESALESSASSTQQSSQQQQNSANNVYNQQQEKKGESGEKKIKDDPRFAKYFTMLKVGIPIDRIQEKMMMEGVDPNILSNPDAPIPRMFSPSQNITQQIKETIHEHNILLLVCSGDNGIVDIILHTTSCIARQSK